ncbi:MAG TPA: phosphonate C-P lyase system protein PhnH [Albitalea sp.]|uniref:phosphonate C-P lyase system protein PhnH n=1 Tax=Piscinibacter sp. TaxID=1903157 RepID=UPI002ED4F8DB
MSAVLAEMSPGFRDPVHGAQQVFRALLDAMARPGFVRPLPASALDGIGPPAAMGIGTAAVMLTLLDTETTACLAGGMDDASARAYLRFHCGVRCEASVETAAFVIARASDVDAALCAALALGSDEAPQAGATLVIEVGALDKGTRLVLQGPGIETRQALAVTGLPPAFWRWRIALQAEMPRGIDLLLVHGTRIAAIPRSTRIELEA